MQIRQSSNDISQPDDVTTWLKEIQLEGGISARRIAEILGTSRVALRSWVTGSGEPSGAQRDKLRELHRWVKTPVGQRARLAETVQFASSKRNERSLRSLPIFASTFQEVNLSADPLPPILDRLSAQRRRATSARHEGILANLLARHVHAARLAQVSPDNGMSAGKNTYTYDAHTYHTKVPPQGIAELLSHYLPDGGLVLDPFAGSGMTGVAARVLGLDCILSELSPAACFIADRFTQAIDPLLFERGVQTILNETSELRRQLYTTSCRECGRPTEILYTVWSYQVRCPYCADVFVLWDHCRKYGRTVREHKILREFACPSCNKLLKKSRLERLDIVPVMLGYKCCGSRQQEVTHPLTKEDLDHLEHIRREPPLAQGFYPTTALPDGVNLNQPKRHGLDRIDKMYTPRNLAAASYIWQTIHRVEDTELAGFLAFTFTSLYRRITRMSEFRFWGGSGNTANFNVPFIFEESNVFLSFERKAHTINDHLATTATSYKGECVVINESATNLRDIPCESIDLVFTDPPFGANINYSEMNILWESWLGAFTDATEEAIVNRAQGKGLDEYQALMTESLQECYRVLRSGSWLLLVFMNSSGAVWARLRQAIIRAGFEIQKVDIFDKQHGTFKQFVNDNTAGCDLVLHCRKFAPRKSALANTANEAMIQDSVSNFVERFESGLPQTEFLHVARDNEINFRKLYSDWLSERIRKGEPVTDFARFREAALLASERRSGGIE